MTLKPNTTCDIYRGSSSPPAPPDVAGVGIVLQARWTAGQEHGEGRSIDFYTHVALMPLATDVRDDNLGPTPDTVYVPDQTGTVFQVVWVERRRTGNRNDDYKIVYLKRIQANWPTEEL